jgi:hypothetical protein
VDLGVKLSILPLFKQVIKDRKWKELQVAFNFPHTTTSAAYVLRKYYIVLLHHYEQVYFLGTQGPLVPPPSRLHPLGAPRCMTKSYNYQWGHWCGKWIGPFVAQSKLLSSWVKCCSWFWWVGLEVPLPAPIPISVPRDPISEVGLNSEEIGPQNAPPIPTLSLVVPPSTWLYHCSIFEKICAESWKVWKGTLLECIVV